MYVFVCFLRTADYLVSGEHQSMFCIPTPPASVFFPSLYVLLRHRSTWWIGRKEEHRQYEVNFIRFSILFSEEKKIIDLFTIKGSWDENFGTKTKSRNKLHIKKYQFASTHNTQHTKHTYRLSVYKLQQQHTRCFCLIKIKLWHKILIYI